MLLTDAISFVRARMDEIAFNQDDMITAVLDDRNLDTTIERLLPEAAEVVFLSAPEHMLEPQEIFDSSEVDFQHIESFTRVVASSEVDIVLAASAKFLRLVFFKADDSSIFLTKAVPFNSPLARQQANPYVRGTVDAPVLVKQELNNGQLKLSYYGLTDGADISFGYIRKSVVSNGEIFCPLRLEDAVLNQLTGMVLETYGDQRSQQFYSKSNGYLQ